VLEQRWPALRATTGNKAMPGFTAPKLVWVAKHEPEIFAATKLVLLPKAYLRLVLTGEAIEDVSDASGSLWLDVTRRDWSDEGLSATVLSRS
jgi:xylulokinase